MTDQDFDTSTVILLHQTKNSNNKDEKKIVSWAEEWQWKEGEEEKVQAKKTAFRKKRAALKRAKMETWVVDKAEWMYSILISDNNAVHEKIVEICNEHINSMGALTNVFLSFGMGFVEPSDFMSALSRFGKPEQDAEADKKNLEQDGKDNVDCHNLWHGWEKYVLGPYTKSRGAPMPAINLSLLLSCSPIRKQFQPRYVDVTTVASDDVNEAVKLNTARALVNHLDDGYQRVCLHYAQHANPDNPPEAIPDFFDRWNLNETSESAPIGHVHDGNPGSSAASSLTDINAHASSPSRKKHKSGDQAGISGGSYSLSSPAPGSGSSTAKKDEPQTK
eukprot:CAMPEP_0113499730 /NCGR_PEP_ID=MMETSP0014_2-20120614/31914_1 /TAXON_ID=2857 /ORGANISM="Nitzschia sp." /LENGTH=332 /DNA_ID=CAMNT_0000393945 /DNA_START=104 /DNA_END=1102 /DNA_ORIENTATION=+ /assembly_acc=CAM_ASM_000159